MKVVLTDDDGVVFGRWTISERQILVYVATTPAEKENPLLAVERLIEDNLPVNDENEE